MTLTLLHKITQQRWHVIGKLTVLAFAMVLLSVRGGVARRLGCINEPYCSNITLTNNQLPECVGDACTQVALTWDDSKQQYKAQNSSTSRWIRIDAANLVQNASICVGPEKTEYLPLKSLVGKYRANYNEESCGKGI